MGTAFCCVPHFNCQDFVCQIIVWIIYLRKWGLIAINSGKSKEKSMEIVDKITDVAAAPQGDMMSTLIFIGAMFAIVYFMMIMPNRKRMKEYRAMLEKLTVGSKILMAGGIYGVVRKIDDKDLEVEIAKGVIVKIPRSAVANVE